MFKNYLKIAFRNLWKNKTLSFINIVGLSIGMAGAILLILNIQFEYSVDRFHQNKDHIYKVYNRGPINGKLECWDNSSPLLATTLKDEIPDLKQVARVAPAGKLFSFGDKKLSASGDYVDPSFLNMFSFPLVKGNAVVALNDPHSIVITEKLAKKIFGDADPVNKVILADNTDNFTVTGVLKDLPFNTDFDFEYLIPWQFLRAKGIEYASWDHIYARTYVELQSSARAEAVNDKIKNVTINHTDRKQQAENFLYPLKDAHLRNRFTNGQPSGGNIDNVRTLGILAGIILLIACINFMNLSTARSEKRAKEVGVRKVIGAGKRSLVIQFIGESIIMAFFAGLIGLLIVQFAMPTFSTMVNAHVSVNYLSPLFWLAGLGFVLFTGFLAGTYPAFYLSSFKPVKVLKGVLKNGNAMLTPRKVLVVLQFVFSILLINFTILFKRQMTHMEDREIGFVKDNLIFNSLTPDLKRNYESVKNELISSGTAISVCKSNTPITRGASDLSGLKWSGMDVNQNISFALITTTGGFVKTNELQLAAGRDIDVASYPMDTASCMINETAAKVMGLKSPVGQFIKDKDFNWKIVGVIKDFVIGSPTQAITPMFIRGSDDANYISLRLNSARPSIQNARSAEAILKKYNPAYLTEIQFADQDYAAKFKQAQNASTLINVFAAIAIFISCMGLFALSIYMAENRIKEIGIRKVLGASLTGIIGLLVRYFVKLVVIAIVIASPLAWLLMNSFLQQFEYRTEVSWWILLVAGVVTLGIAIFTISFQSVKAALANPTKSLRAD